MSKSQEIKKNSLIKDNYGIWHTVYEMRGNIIYTIDQSHVHITKVVEIKTQENQNQNQNIPVSLGG